MFDRTLKEQVNTKIQDGEFEISDLPAFFEVFSQLGNQVEDLQDEVDEWDCVVEFEMVESGTYWLSIEDGQFTTGIGSHPETRLRLIMAASDAVKIFSGEKDAEAALNSGELKLEGDLPDAIKLHFLIELVLEEIEN